MNEKRLGGSVIKKLINLMLYGVPIFFTLLFAEVSVYAAEYNITKSGQLNYDSSENCWKFAGIEIEAGDVIKYGGEWVSLYAAWGEVSIYIDGTLNRGECGHVYIPSDVTVVKIDGNKLFLCTNHDTAAGTVHVGHCDSCGLNSEGAVYVENIPVQYKYPEYNTPNDAISGAKEWKTGERNAIVVMSSDSIWGTEGQESWYVVKDDITINHTVCVDGNVNLIIEDGKSLNISSNSDYSLILNSEATLTILGQESGSGKLIVKSNMSDYGSSNAGVYLDNESNLILNGAIVETKAASSDMMADPGINQEDDGKIIVNNGSLVCTGGESNGQNYEGNYSGAGIEGGALYINAGTVTTSGGVLNESEVKFADWGRNIIGDGIRSCNVYVRGGILTANGGSYNKIKDITNEDETGAGMNGGTLNVTGGYVTLNGGEIKYNSTIKNYAAVITDTKINTELCVKAGNSSSESTVITKESAESWFDKVGAYHYVNISEVTSEDIKSVLVIPDDGTPQIQVSGLPEEANKAADENPGKAVEVKMVADKLTEETAEGSADIKALADPLEELEYFDFDIIKTIWSFVLGVRNDTPDSQSNIHNTSSVMTLCIPYDTNGKTAEAIKVYRHHNDGINPASTEILTRYESVPENPVDGSYYVDMGNSSIKIYAQKFSTYAIGYKPETTVQETNDHNDDINKNNNNNNNNNNNDNKTEEEPEIEATSLKIKDPGKKILTIQGETLQLEAVITPSNVTSTIIMWKSSNEQVISVDANGKITALAEGKAVITASTYNGQYDSVEIMVSFSNSDNLNSNDLTNTDTTGENVNASTNVSPKTGDSNNSLFWFILMFGLIAIAVFDIFYKKKER